MSVGLANAVVTHRHLGPEPDGTVTYGPFGGLLISKQAIEIKNSKGKPKTLTTGTFHNDNGFETVSGDASNLEYILANATVGEYLTLDFLGGTISDEREPGNVYVYTATFQDNPERTAWANATQRNAALAYKRLGVPMPSCNGHTPAPIVAEPDVVEFVRTRLRAEVTQTFQGFVKTPDDIVSTPVRWVVRDIIPRGFLGMLAAKGGTGKGTWCADTIARYSNGQPLPGFVKPARSLRFLIVAGQGEDDLPRAWKPRLEAAGYNPSNVVFVDDTPFGAPSISPDCLGFYEWAITTYDIDCVVFDSLSSLAAAAGLEVSTKPNREAMDPLSGLVERLDVGGLLIHHTRKDAGEGDLVDQVMGSGLNTAAVRAVTLIAYDPADAELPLPQRGRILASVKGNYSATAVLMRFVIDSHTFTDSSGRPIIEEDGMTPWTTSKVRWTDETLAGNAQDLLAPKSGKESETMVDKVAAFLLENYPEGIWHPSDEVTSEAKRQVGGSLDTVRRAREKAGFVSRKFGKPFFIGRGSLPSAPPDDFIVEVVARKSKATIKVTPKVPT